jgi:2-oxo-4-hydroxy-4-carboxy-5-ureidoimidazoline decarboxylase
MTFAELNSADRERFVGAIGWVFENSPWVAERVFAARPFRDTDALHRAMIGEVERATPEEKLALLRAHPDLGTRARVSDTSRSEQNGAGLDQLTATEFARLHELNRKYRAKFGFPFLFAVKGRTKQEILRALAERLEALPEEEYRVALEQVDRIARFRLEEIFV